MAAAAVEAEAVSGFGFRVYGGGDSEALRGLGFMEVEPVRRLGVRLQKAWGLGLRV